MLIIIIPTCLPTYSSPASYGLLKLYHLDQMNLAMWLNVLL